jgi:vacuolar-type H+-ATPase subunit C/Vma6
MSPAAGMYVITRVHGLRTHLIEPRDIRILAKAKTLREVSDSLLKTSYATEIGKLPTEELDAAALEGIFLSTLVERFFFVPKAAQGSMQDLLKRYCRRFEVENIKRIIRAKHGGQAGEEPRLIPLSREYTLVNFGALLEANSVDEVVSLLRETDYGSLSEKLQSYRETNAATVLEAALDGIYFGKIWKMAQRVSGKGVRMLVGEEMDLTNLLITFSLKAREVIPSVVEDSLIHSSYSLPEAKLRSLVQSRLEDAPSILTGRYSELASQAVSLLKSGSSSSLERLFFKQLYEDASLALRTFSLDAGYVLAYLLLCECEAKNLISIAIGKQLNLSEEEIEQGLLGI